MSDYGYNNQTSAPQAGVEAAKQVSEPPQPHSITAILSAQTRRLHYLNSRLCDLNERLEL